MQRGDLVWAARPFGYGRVAMLGIGQVVKLEGARNDEKLVRLGLLREVDRSAPRAKCGQCGAEFINEFFLNQHGKITHADLTDAERLDAIEASDSSIASEIPLFLDKTTGSGAGPDPIQLAPRRRGRPPKHAVTVAQ